MTGVLDFFKNYGPIITFLIGITGLGLGLFYFLKNRKQKKLEYVISNKTPLFNQLHSKMKIFFNDQQIKEDACLSVLTIENIGNEPIKEEEFEKSKPLKINLLRSDGAPVSIFDVEIYTSNPLDFNVEFDCFDSEGTLSIKPILFNPKDYVSLKLISTEFEHINISGRIIGGSVVNGEKRKKRKVLQNRFITYGGALLVGILGAISNRIFDQMYMVIIFGIIVVTIGSIMHSILVLDKVEDRGRKQY
ncbi:hypothetical protein [Bacillus thuringiensis]|uniref:hypothetical protein n=1 Tax=Bacillus thuringiensis TaxID=1428 RepID=UPI000BF409B7|nr:hypothetical protein [Bacillus thuringiensis]PEY71443.1 hypothetical protein CN355_19870 [Bacillus thuringiensis]